MRDDLDRRPASVARPQISLASKEPVPMIPAENLRKVAILVSVLPQDEARQVLMGLNEFQISAVLRQISALRDMPLSERLPVLKDFVNSHMQYETTQEPAARIESATRHLRYDEPWAEASFSFLREIPAERIAEELQEERPQMIAVVLAHLPARQVSRILQELPEPLKTDTVKRLADMGPTDRDTIRELERVLESRLSDCVGGPMTQLGGVHFVAEVLRGADPEIEGELLNSISHEDPHLGDVIRQSLHRFCDIFELSDRDIRMLLRHVETSQWAVALRGCDEASIERIMDNLNETEAESLRQQMQWLGPVRRTKVEQMQARIVDILRRLRAAKIVMGREGLATTAE